MRPLTAWNTAAATGINEAGVVVGDSTLPGETEQHAFIWQEGRDGRAGHPTYASITSRSFHPGIVQAGMMDGSVHVFSEEVDLRVWRALGTRAGREVLGDDDF